MTSKILIPILHFDGKVPEGMIWAMHETITLMQINPIDLGPVTAHIPRDLYDLTDRDAGCFYITPPREWESYSEDLRGIKIARWATIIRFAMHRFMGGDSGPLQLTFAVELNDGNFQTLFPLTTVDSSYSPVMRTFILPNEEARATINAYIAVLLAANSKMSTLIAYERYNSSLFRTSVEDKLIDCTISAESLIGATTELSYKFSLFLSFVAGRDAELRNYVFKLLKLMYEARSKLVHGDPKSGEKLASVQAQWKNIHTVLLGCLDYYATHHAQESLVKSDWLEHLNALVIGGAERTAPVCGELKVPAPPEPQAEKVQKSGQRRVRTTTPNAAEKPA